MTDNLAFLPVWNKHSSAADRFRELALMAERDPSKFEKVAIIWEGAAEKDSQSKTDYSLVNCNTTELIGLIELGKFAILRYTHGMT